MARNLLVTRRAFATMKSLLLSFFVGLAVASTVVKDNAFRPRREYLYHYDTQLLTGLPHTSTIHSGFRLSCNARVQFTTYSKIRVMLENVVLYKVNEPIMQNNVHQRLLPVEHLKELPFKEAMVMKTFLKMPFGFEYTNGIVLSVAFTDREVEWSINIKRAFISLFQMNLSKRMLLGSNDAGVSSTIPGQIDLYTVMEQSTLGDCATLYTVSPTQQAKSLYVTKTRDFSRCVDHPTYFKSIFENQQRSDYVKDEPLVQEANMKYSVRGNRDKFIIVSAVSEGRILFSPYKNQGEILTSVNQTMYLRDSKSLDHTVEIPEVQPGKHKQNTLRMTLPSEPVDSQDAFQLQEREPKQLDQPADVYTAEKIKLHLKLAAEDTIQLTSEQALTHLRVAIDMLKTSPQPIIVKLWNQLNTEKPIDDISILTTQILWKILPNVATEAATNVVLDICNKQFLMTENCTWSLGKLALRATPTTQIISKLIELTDTRLRPLYPSVKQAAYLALGSLGYKMNVQKKNRLEVIERSMQLLESLTKDSVKDIRHIIKQMKKELENRRHKIINIWSTTEEKIWTAFKKLLQSPIFDDKVLALKSIGNSGIQEAFPTLKKYLYSPAEPYILRILAVTAFRRIEYPEEARREAISTLRTKVLDTKERSEVRNLAFEIMTGLRPELPIYETISDSLRTEKDKHVSTFILSFFRTYANSSYPPHWEMKKNATASLLLGPTERLEDTSAHFKQFSTFSEDYKLGGVLKMSSLGDQFGYKGGALSLETYIMGYVSQFAEVGMNTEGLSAVLEKLFGPRGLLSNRKSIFDLLKRAPRDLSPQQMIDHIFKLLQIKPRSMPIPYGHLYFTLMGHELRYFDFTTALRYLTTEGKVPVKFDEDKLSVGLPIDINTMFDFVETQLTLPTEAGIPVSLKLQSLSAVDIKGNVEFKVGPYITEEDRQGSPPVSITSAINLQPRIVFGIRGSMGLDMFYYKPVVGFHTILKTKTPVSIEVSIDTVYNKLKITNFIEKTEYPVVEFLSEPFSQFMVIPKDDMNPVILTPTQQIFAPYGARVTPLSRVVQLDSIGYKLALTGQIPKYLSLWNVIRPMNGRTLVNLFLQPMENAPSKITLDAQLLFANQRSTVSPDYAKTYQNSRTENAEDFGRDMSGMDAGTEKYDKFGRRLPASLDDVLPYSDPVDLNENTVSLQQLANKFQRLRNRPMPFYNYNDAMGLVLTLDASYETTKRQYQLESLWGSLLQRQYNVLLTRLWRNAIPQIDTDTWQAFIENVIVFPSDVFEPKDIFNPRQQAKIMNELQYLLTFNAHRVINQILNVTVLSVDQQFNYPSMVSLPAEKVIQSLIPEQLYKLMNLTGLTIYNRQWQNYWETLGPVYKRITEESRIIVDRFYVKREIQILELLETILRVQKDFLADIDDVTSKGFIAHAESPILQAINSLQMKSTYLLKLVTERAYQRGLIDHVDIVQGRLERALANVDLITTKVDILWRTVSSVSQELGAEGRPVVLFRPSILRQHGRQPKYYQANTLSDLHQHYRPLSNDFSSQPSSYYNSDGDKDSEASNEDYYPSVQEPQWTIDELRYSLYNLTLAQMNVIKEIETAVFNKADINYNCLKFWVTEVRRNITLIDQVLKSQPVLDIVAKESILLVTVQNSMLVVLLEEWQQIHNDKNRPEPRMMEKFARLEFYMKAIKGQGNYLAERSAFMYRTQLLARVLLPYLTTQEVPIFRETDQLVRQLMPQLREFEMYMVYNVSNMRNPDAITAVYTKFITDMDRHIVQALNIERALNRLPTLPKVYMVSEIMDTIGYMKRMVEYARTHLLSIQDTQRLEWIQKLNQQATRIQTLMAGLSPVFSKYSESHVMPRNTFQSVFLTAPVNAKLLDLQDVTVQQKMLLDQIRKFLQNPDVSNTILADVLKAAVDRCDVVQQTLKQNHPQVLTVLEEASFFQRESISAIYTQTLNQQSILYEALRSTLENNRDRLVDVAQQVDRIQNLELDLSQLMNEKDNKLNSLKDKEDADANVAERFDTDEETYPYDSDDSYVAEKASEALRKPVYSRVGVPHGAVGLINMTWGQRDLFDKNFQIELTTSRTVEQMLYIFKQMSAVLRSNDVAEAVNNRLSGEPWKNMEVLRKLNSFNHLHLVANYDKKTLPYWFLNWADYFNDYMKVMFWHQYTRQQPLTSLPDGQFHALVEISDFNKQWDLYLMSNTETDRFIGNRQHDLLKRLPITEPLTITNQRLFNKQCIVNKNKLFTFDKVSYPLPYHMDQCRTLLAMDCTLEKAFAITILKANSSYQGNILQILTEDKEIEIIPGYLDIQVKINGKFIVLSENVPVVYRKQVHYGQNRPSLILLRKGLRVEVTLPLTGVFVAMEGAYVALEVSEMYQKKVCGLCSNYDDQLSWEYEGPGQEVYTTAKPFVYSYILREGQCPMNHRGDIKAELDPIPPPTHPDYTKESARYNDIMRHFRPRGDAGRIPDSEEDQDQQTDDICEPSIERSIKPRRSKGQICISQKPVRKCPLECSKAVRIEKEKVTYICLDQNDSQIDEIRQAASRGPMDPEALSNISRIQARVRRLVKHEAQCQQDSITN